MTVEYFIPFWKNSEYVEYMAAEIQKRKFLVSYVKNKKCIEVLNAEAAGKFQFASLRGSKTAVNFYLLYS